MPSILEVSRRCWVHSKWLFLQGDFDFYKEKMLTKWKCRGITFAKLVHVNYHLLLQKFRNRRIKFGNLWLNLHLTFLIMTKMRGKIPFFKKEMYGSQKKYVFTKFYEWRHNNIKMPILVLVIFCEQLHLMQKQISKINNHNRQFFLFVANS